MAIYLLLTKGFSLFIQKKDAFYRVVSRFCSLIKANIKMPSDPHRLRNHLIPVIVHSRKG
jgi:hypothetical protein